MSAFFYKDRFGCVATHALPSPLLLWSNALRLYMYTCQHSGSDSDSDSDSAPAVSNPPSPTTTHSTNNPV